MVLGAQNTVHTDHKNLTYASTVNQRVICQLNYLKEHSPKYEHIPGKNNVIADSFSHLPHHEDIDYPLEEEKEWLYKVDLNLFCTSVLDDQELVDCYLNLPDLNLFPWDFEHIAQGQQADALLQQQHMLHPSQYFNGRKMISYGVTPTARWQICIPNNQ
jgi:hypothetical protein